MRTVRGSGREHLTDARTKVLVLNDDQALTSLLEQFLVRDRRLDLVARARTTISALAEVWEHDPQAIVIEQHQNGTDWLAALPTLRRYCPNACIVVVHSDPEHGELAMTRGASHDFDRSHSWQDILDVLAPPVCEDDAFEPLPAAR